MKNYYMKNMTWVELNEKIEQVLILPVGATEQHGHHLPLSTDSIIAEELSVKLAEKIDGVVAPTFTYGYKSNPLSGGGPLFCGTIDLNGKTLIDLTVNVLEEFCKDGFTRIFVNNAHFENEAFLLEAISIVSEKYPKVNFIESNWWDVLTTEVIDELFDGCEFPGWALEHAALTETSLIMHLMPELVRTELMSKEKGIIPIPYHKYPIVKGMVPDSGVLAPADGSSARKGQLITDFAVNEFVAIIEKELQ